MGKSQAITNTTQLSLNGKKEKSDTPSALLGSPEFQFAYATSSLLLQTKTFCVSREFKPIQMLEGAANNFEAMNAETRITVGAKNWLKAF